MIDILLFFAISGAGALALALAYLAFELLLFTVYTLSGGRFDLISYLKNDKHGGS